MKWNIPSFLFLVSITHYTHTSPQLYFVNTYLFDYIYSLFFFFFIYCFSYSFICLFIELFILLIFIFILLVYYSFFFFVYIKVALLLSLWLEYTTWKCISLELTNTNMFLWLIFK